MKDYGGTVFYPYGSTADTTQAILARYQRRQGPNGAPSIHPPGLCELVEGVACALEADDEESIRALAQRMSDQPTRDEIDILELNTALGTLPTLRFLIDYYQVLCEGELKRRGYSDEYISGILNEAYSESWPASGEPFADSVAIPAAVPSDPSDAQQLSSEESADGA